MENQTLQHEMADILGKHYDSELGQNTINANLHGRTKKNKEKKTKMICRTKYEMYFSQFLENVYNSTIIPKCDLRETF